jgi:hypothetical protein
MCTATRSVRAASTCEPRSAGILVIARETAALCLSQTGWTSDRNSDRSASVLRRTDVTAARGREPSAAAGPAGGIPDPAHLG